MGMKIVYRTAKSIQEEDSVHILQNTIKPKIYLCKETLAQRSAVVDSDLSLEMRWIVQ